MLTNTAELEKECSARELDQLSDLNGTGERNEGVIADAIADTEALVSSYISIPVNPTPLLRQIAARLTVIELRRRNELLRDADKELRRECEGTLMKMAGGRIPVTLAEQESASPADRLRGAYRHGAKQMDTSGYRL